MKLPPYFFSGSFNPPTNTVNYSYSLGTWWKDAARQSYLFCGWATYVSTSIVGSQYYHWVPGTPDTASGSYNLNSLGATVKLINNSQSVVSGSYTYYTSGTGATAEIWKKLTTDSGSGTKFVTSNADSPIISNNFLIYRNISKGYKLYEIDLLAKCVGSIPVGSQTSNTNPITATDYQNTDSNASCYYSIPTSCIGTPNGNQGTVTNTGGYLGSVTLQSTDSNAACFVPCKTGYTGVSCSSLSNPITTPQEYRMVYAPQMNLFNLYLGRLSTGGNPWYNGYSVTTGINSQIASYKVNNKGTFGYTLSTNGMIKETDLISGNTIRTIASDVYTSSFKDVYTSSFNIIGNPIAISYDDKRLYYQSFDGSFYYINKVDLIGGTTVKFIKSTSMIFTFKESPDGNWFFYRNQADGARLYKKSIVSTDLNDNGNPWLNSSYSGYDITFTSDGNNILYGNSTFGIYQKSVYSSDSSFLGTQINNSSYYSSVIKETPDGTKILTKMADGYLYIIDKQTGITVKTGMYGLGSFVSLQITEDSKYVVYFNQTTLSYYINDIGLTGLGIPINLTNSPMNSTYGGNMYHLLQVLPINPNYFTPPVFQGKEVWNEEKVIKADSLNTNKALNQTSKDVMLYQTGGIFGDSTYLYTPIATTLTSISNILNNNGFVTTSNQNVFTIKVGGRAITVKVVK